MTSAGAAGTGPGGARLLSESSRIDQRTPSWRGIQMGGGGQWWWQVSDEHQKAGSTGRWWIVIGSVNVMTGSYGERGRRIVTE